MHVPARIDIDRLQEGLRTKRFGRSIIFQKEVGSTNDGAKELAAYGAGEGTVVVAERQTAGRGRLGREWFSPSGGLWFSIILLPKLRVSEAVPLVFVAGLAVAKTLRELYGLGVGTLWPNDVLVGDRKICGILTEMNSTGEVVNFVVLGIGINANIDVKEALPKQLRDAATSLGEELGQKIRIEELLKALLETLEVENDLFLEKGAPELLSEWKQYAAFLGHNVEISRGEEKFVGIAQDVENDGSLVLKLVNGSFRRFLVGDISLRVK